MCIFGIDIDEMTKLGVYKFSPTINDLQKFSSDDKYFFNITREEGDFSLRIFLT